MRTTPVHEFVFDAFDDRSWRLLDTAVEPRQAGNVVAYVEKIRGDYEVIWVWGTHGSDRFSSLDAVKAAAQTLLEVNDRARGTRPVPIPRRPPVPN